MRWRRCGLQDRASGTLLLKTGRIVRREGRRSTFGDVWPVIDGSSFASATSPSCAEATEWHQAIATSMGPGLSSRVESRTWRRNRNRSRNRSKERAGAGRRDEMAIWMLDGGWLAVDQPVWSWPDAAGLVWEVWEVRYGLADCSSPMQSTQFLCRGCGHSSSRADQGRLGPNFRWRREPGAQVQRARLFRARQLQILRPPRHDATKMWPMACFIRVIRSNTLEDNEARRTCFSRGCSRHESCLLSRPGVPHQLSRYQPSECYMPLHILPKYHGQSCFAWTFEASP